MLQNNSSNNSANAPVGIDFKRYYRLFKRKKWLILGIFSVVFIFVFLAALRLGPEQIYTTSALLQFDDRRALSGIEDRGRPENDSKLGMLMSRSFLKNVVDKLNYTFQISGSVRRASAIDSIYLAEDHKLGKYRIEKDNGQFKLLYTSPDKTAEDKVIFEGDLAPDYRLAINGFELYTRKSFWDTHQKLQFYLLNELQAVEKLRSSLNPNFKNRSRTLLGIEISGTDPDFITLTLNTLIDEFVKQNIDFKKYHTREVLNILSEQLKTAKADLDSAVEDLKVFREKNPWVGLDPGASGAITGISSLESDKLNVQDNTSELEMLLNRVSNVSGEAKYPILSEILSFLGASGVATVPALSSELASLRAERDRLQASYSAEHPVIQENERKLGSLEEKILLTARNLINSYNDRIAKINSQIQEESYKIRSLPTKELQFAELQRRRNVADQIYSSLLVRHNQAKVADAVEVGDVIVLDKAVKPLGGGSFAQLLKYLILAFGLGIALSFGSVIAFDFLDKTVRTSDELEKAVPIRVVAKIPVVGSSKDIPEEVFDSTKRIDPKLVTADYSPTPMGEAYRSLRTQLLFSNEHKRNRSLFVTSLNPGEGKSLNAGNLAITFAQQKIPTLLVDADLRRGVLHSSFACDKKPGLSDFLYSNADINEENIRKVIQQTHIPNLHLLSSGMPVPNPSEILGSQRGKDVIRFLNERFGFVIVDTPPIMVTADSVVISQYVDQGLFVIRAGKTNVDEVKQKIAEYQDFHKKLFGLVLNCAELDVKEENYKYSYYNY